MWSMPDTTRAHQQRTGTTMTKHLFVQCLITFTVWDFLETPYYLQTMCYFYTNPNDVERAETTQPEPRPHTPYLFMPYWRWNGLSAKNLWI